MTAVRQILLKLCETAVKLKDDPIELDREIHKTSKTLVSTMHMQMCVAVMSAHTSIKKEMIRIINDALDGSGKELSSSFKEALEDIKND